jgi:hypothetical protein
MGRTVTNLQDEKLGNVENLVVELPAGRITAVVISSGGFIGMAGKLCAIPPAGLRYNAEHQTLQFDSSKEMLAGLPRFKANE